MTFSVHLIYLYLALHFGSARSSRDVEQFPVVKENSRVDRIACMELNLVIFLFFLNNYLFLCNYVYTKIVVGFQFSNFGHVGYYRLAEFNYVLAFPPARDAWRCVGKIITYSNDGPCPLVYSRGPDYHFLLHESIGT